jgi:hypothetical protein
MPEPQDGPARLIEQMRDEKLTLRIYEQADRGGTKRFWTLAREASEGEKPLVIGGTMDELAKVRDLIDRQLNELHWKQTNGSQFACGTWFERHSAPHVGQIVTVGDGRDYRGEGETRKVTPLGRAVDPGEPKNPVYLVIERDESRYGRGRVVAITSDQAEAVEKKNELERVHFQEQALGPQWNTLTFRP